MGRELVAEQGLLENFIDEVAQVEEQAIVEIEMEVLGQQPVGQESTGQNSAAPESTGQDSQNPPEPAPRGPNTRSSNPVLVAGIP